MAYKRRIDIKVIQKHAPYPFNYTNNYHSKSDYSNQKTVNEKNSKYFNKYFSKTNVTAII